MGRPIRISDEMMHLAEADSVLSKRSPPKQIEFWAEIGRRIEQQLTQGDLTVLLQGFATVSLVPPDVVRVDAQAVFDQVDTVRDNGTLADEVTQAPVRYETSPTHPGYIDRLTNGQRETGRFHNGEFIPLSTSE